MAVSRRGRAVILTTMLAACNDVSLSEGTQ
jgi:hypothetical protein